MKGQLRNGCRVQSKLAIMGFRMVEETMNSPKVQRIKDALEAWLDDKNWSFDQLRRWLKGYELPAVGYDREPYFWIIMGVAQSQTARREMAKRISAFLNAEPYHSLFEGDNNDLFYNLFHVSAAIGDKHILGEPLSRVFDYLALDKNRLEAILNIGPYNLCNAFREALIANQTDTRYRRIWIDGLNGYHEVSFCRGDSYSHFRGILYMSDNDRPLVGDIGWGLKKLCHHLEPEDRRIEKLWGLIQRVKEVWPYSKFSYDWNAVLRFQAMHHNWPDWAMIELYELSGSEVQRASGDKEVHFQLLDEMLSLSFDKLRKAVPQNSPTEVPAQIEISDYTVTFLSSIEPTLESLLLHSPNKTYLGLKKVFQDMLTFPRDFLVSKGRIELAQAIQELKIEILTDVQPDEKKDIAKTGLTRAAARAGLPTL
jgi:hypothetical protein